MYRAMVIDLTSNAIYYLHRIPGNFTCGDFYLEYYTSQTVDEPHIAVRPHGDAVHATFAAGDRIFGNVAHLRVDFPDFTDIFSGRHVIFSKPDAAVRSGCNTADIDAAVVKIILCYFACFR